ncbi:MAG TPA: MFS transporter [Longimicrobiales bacterium]
MPASRVPQNSKNRSYLLRFRWLRGNVLWLGLVSLLNDTASEMVFPLLPLFLVGTLGAGPTILGVIEGVAETTASLVKLGSGWISDRIGRRKSLVGWGYGIAVAARPLLALTGAPWQVLVLRFADRVGKGVRTAPRDALLAESAPAERRGAAFGIHRAADHIGAVMGPLLAAGLLLLAPHGLRLVFALAALPGLLAVALVVFAVRETPVARPAPVPAGGAEVGHDGGARSGDDDDAADRTTPARRGLLAVLGLFTLGNASDAFLLLHAEHLGVATALVPILWGALNVSKSLWSVPGGALADRVGAGRVIIGGWVVYAAVYVGFAFAGAAWHAWALFIVYGLFYGLTEAPEKALIAALGRAGRRGTAFGAYHLVTGAAALPASVLFGAIWAASGPMAAFLFGAGLALLSAALLPLALRRTAN